jgi:hypothetical protein
MIRNLAPLPPIDPIITAQKVEATLPNPTLDRMTAEPPPLYTLKQAEGEFALSGGVKQNTVRPVMESEIEELVPWGLDRIKKRYPRATPEGLVPFLRLAVRGGRYRYLRTDNAQGIFVCDVLPWEPRGIVWDLVVIGKRDRDLDPRKVQLEVIGIYVAGEAWARSINAAQFKFELCDQVNAEMVAKRIGYDAAAGAYEKSLLK